MAMEQAYSSLLTPQLEAALQIGSRHLISAGFADLVALHEGRVAIADTQLVTHLPGRYLRQYTPSLLQRFLVCIIVVGWKLAQPQRLKLACVAEELAAWALITEADLYLDQGRAGQPFVSHFDAFAAELFDGTGFLRLFDDALYAVEDTELPKALGNPALALEHWFDSLHGGASDDGPMALSAVHPYVQEPENA